MRRMLSIVLILMLVFSMAACSKPAGPAGKDESDWEIVVVPKDASNPWFVRMEVGVKEYAAETD